MALVGRDARVNGWRDQSAHFGRRDEEWLRPRTPFRLGRFAICVTTELRPAVLARALRHRVAQRATARDNDGGFVVSPV